LVFPARRVTRTVNIGGVKVGHGEPVVIQSMTNTRTADYISTLEQIKSLHQSGCELIRVAVPDKEAAEALEYIVRESPIPVIADIHFDLGLAHLAIEKGAAKVRINPGNAGGEEKMFELAEKARSFGVPVRIGVNAGSLDREIALKYGGATPEALAGSASNYAAALDKAGFKDVVVSIKASDVYTTICANRLFAEKNDNPLHLGVTEAGTPGQGVIKNAIGIGTLLAEGIGDTVRVSLTAPPEEEIKAARSILQSLGLRVFGPEIISCPTCGRCEIDLIALAEKVEAMLNDYTMPVRVAVMGCAVNGPGEAREADLGIAAGKKEGILFKKGKVVKTVSEDKVLDTIREELALFKRENDHVS